MLPRLQNQPPDSVLIARFQVGESGVFDLLYRRHRDRMNRKVYYALIGEFASEAIVGKVEPRRVILNQDGTSTVYQLPRLW